MRKKIVSVTFMLLLIGFSSVIALANTAEIEIDGENQYKSIRLTPQIYNKSNYDLSDILIKDDSGENVPYFINSGMKNTVTNKKSYSMELVNSYLKDDSFYFDYSVAVAQTSDIISTSVEFTTKNTTFAKEVDVYGSYDNINWDFIQNDKIYVIDDKSKLEIEFNQPQKFTYYRLKLANNLEQISFDFANLVYSVEKNEETYFIESLEPEFSIETSDKRTNIVIEGLKNLRLCDITIYSGSMFKRSAYTSHGVNKEIFNLSLDETVYSDTTIALDRYISNDETYTVTIIDADDKPIQVDRVVVRYFADEIVFGGGSGEIYTLEFGEDPAKISPVYDIDRYKDEILKGSIDRFSLGEISYATEPPQAKRDYKLIFNIVIIGITLLLGTVIFLKLKQKQ